MDFEIRCDCGETLFMVTDRHGRINGKCHICNRPYAGIFKSGSKKLKGIAEKKQGKDAVLHIDLWVKDKGVNE